MHDYDNYFMELLTVTAHQKMDEKVAEAVKKHATKFLGIWNRKDFDRYQDNYIRTYIGKDEVSGWEAIVMSWKKGNQTKIHGHPDFASYTSLTGELLVETFEPTVANKCRKVSEYMVTNGQGFYAIGKEGEFNNHIHRISCLSDTAHSLHIYSDDALLGITYEV